MKRRWFQIHLSTAVVLMLVAGVLLWANVRERQGHRYVTLDSEEAAVQSALGIHDPYSVVRGWPFTHQEWLSSKTDIFKSALLAWAEAQVYGNLWYPGSLAMNVLVALVILLSTASVCEWRIRPSIQKAIPHA